MTRPEQGEYNVWSGETLFLSMSASHFDDLVHRITAFIEHAPTHSMPFSSQERLVVTLQVLAPGNSQNSKLQNGIDNCLLNFL